MNEENLTSWKKGQSGNSRGGSRKQRSRKLLRDFVNDRLSEEFTEEERKALEVVVEGIERGSELAARIVNDALEGHDKARDQVISLQPKEVDLTGDVNLTSDEDHLADRLDALATRRRKSNGAAKPNGSGAKGS